MELYKKAIYETRPFNVNACPLKKINQMQELLNRVSTFDTSFNNIKITIPML
jgi:hypothetical protein